MPVFKPIIKGAGGGGDLITDIETIEVTYGEVIAKGDTIYVKSILDVLTAFKTDYKNIQLDVYDVLRIGYALEDGAKTTKHNIKTIWKYNPPAITLIKVRSMGSQDSKVTYEGTTLPNLTSSIEGVFTKYTNSFDYEFPYNKMTEVEDSLGNKFIKIPPIYFKFYHTGDYLRGFDITNVPTTGFSLFPIQSGEKDLYVGKYQAYFNGTKMESKTGKTITFSKNIGEYRTAARANGSGYFANDWQTWQILQLLMTAYFGSTNSNDYIPDNAGSEVPTGVMDTFTGKVAYRTTDAKNTFFGIENILKNGQHFLDGIAMVGTKVYMGSDYTTYTSAKGADYAQMGTVPASNYIKEYAGGFGMYPITTGADQNKYYADYIYSGTSAGPFVVYGGSYWSARADRGLWGWNGSSAFSGAYSGIGSRLIRTLL